MKRAREVEHCFPSNGGKVGIDPTNRGEAGRAKIREMGNVNDDSPKSPMQKTGRCDVTDSHVFRTTPTLHHARETLDPGGSRRDGSTT